MQSITLFFFSLLVFSQSASIGEYGNSKVEFRQPDYIRKDDIAQVELNQFSDIEEDATSQAEFNQSIVNDGIAASDGLVEDDGSAFGYHMKIGVPKALELMMSESRQSRIIGGSQVGSASIIPHQAGIVARLTTGWQSVCGGSLVTNTRVLTAGHCWWDGTNQANLFTIVLGSLTIFSGGTRIETSAVTVHPNWNPKDITNDLAMVQITSVAYSNTIQAIPIPTVNEVNIDFAGMTGTVSGYGRLSDTQSAATTSLYHVDVNIIMNSVCQNILPGVTLHGSHLCTSGTGRVGTCDGDSGGPLTAVYNNRRILVGVVSFGLSEGCEFSSPSVYTRVTAFLNWINANL